MKRLTALLLCLIMLLALAACSKDESGLRKVTLNEVTPFRILRSPLCGLLKGILCGGRPRGGHRHRRAAVTPA